MADAIDINAEGVRIRITGLRETLRSLDKAGADAQDMRDAMHRLGNIVVMAARPRTPTLTGNLAASIRAGRGKTKAVVRAGGARVPYAGVIHYGWPARGIEPQPFLVDAFQSTRSAVFDALDKEIAALLRKNHLV